MTTGHQHIFTNLVSAPRLEYIIFKGAIHQIFTTISASRFDSSISNSLVSSTALPIHPDSSARQSPPLVHPASEPAEYHFDVCHIMFLINCLFLGIYLIS
jgi:hypothetical protein